MKYSEYARSLWDGRINTEPAEWKIVQCFYAALHATNHHCYTGSNGSPRSHKKHIENLAAKVVGIEWVLEEFVGLHQLSERARYHPIKHPIEKEKLSWAETSAERILHQFGIID